METALPALQKALYTTLTNDATLMGMVTGVFDDVPENQPYPYIEIGEGTEVPFRTFGRAGSNCTLTWHIWSGPPQDPTADENAGFLDPLNVLSRMNALLDGKPIVVSGWKTVYVLYDQGDPMKDSDGITRHIPVRYRWVVQQT